MTRAQLLATTAAIAAALTAAALWPSSSEECRAVEIALPSDAGLEYALATVRGPAPDAGEEMIPGALKILDVRPVECPEGAEPMSIAVEPIAWPCACRRTDDVAGACEALNAAADGGETWGPAPHMVTIQSGRWRGECARTACVVVSGVPSFAAECQ